ncbi:hypothetical protein LOTGIDRAFT_234254 [Lottia gigantea]|uniref:Tudor domain-containing protein n=1 Tax=Lottia gigantea TaxID=225164 RepID=V3ZZ29_LOTGI|nr:hypothetical protein LOTGIDRAFT_234254 [Lottia gigantea]ESO89662.1 hypothetical protein LOTGIDRAFT_234254 [Lottia gigantea]
MAGAESGFVLFQRGETDDSDAWDDTALIKAYDEAIAAVKSKLNGSENDEVNDTPDPIPVKHGHGKKKKNKHKNKPRKRQKWKLNDYCRAVYSEDGYIYNAKIISIDTTTDTCIVKYMDYGNEEKQNIAALLRPIAHYSDDKLTSASETESQDQEGEDTGAAKSNHWNIPGFHPPPPPFPGMMPPPFPPGAAGMLPGFRGQRSPRIPTIPPPPPPFYDDNIENDEDALSCMLISWYMSGYHTGYYQGLKQARQQTSGKSHHHHHNHHSHHGGVR